MILILTVQGTNFIVRLFITPSLTNDSHENDSSKRDGIQSYSANRSATSLIGSSEERSRLFQDLQDQVTDSTDKKHSRCPRSAYKSKSPRFSAALGNLLFFKTSTTAIKQLVNDKSDNNRSPRAKFCYCLQASTVINANIRILLLAS